MNNQIILTFFCVALAGASIYGWYYLRQTIQVFADTRKWLLEQCQVFGTRKFKSNHSTVITDSYLPVVDMFIFQDKNVESWFYYNLCGLWCTYFALITPSSGDMFVVLTFILTAATSIMSAATLINIFKLHQQRQYVSNLCETVHSALVATLILDNLSEFDTLTANDIVNIDPLNQQYPTNVKIDDSANNDY